MGDDPRIAVQRFKLSRQHHPAGAIGLWPLAGKESGYIALLEEKGMARISRNKR